jgi:hypothetical protein
MGFDWKAIVRGIAPTIATALGGPMAGLATRALSEKLLGKPDGSEDEISAAIAGATPDQLLKIKELEQQFSKDMAELGLDLAKLEVQDRADARAMQVQTHSRIMPSLAIAITGGFFGVAIAMFFIRLPAENREVITLMVGALIGSFVDVRGFYFGSSASSRAKDDALAQAVQRK